MPTTIGETLKEYLARFPEERVDTCYAQGGSGMYGREGSYYCAGCGKYLGDVTSYHEDDLPMKNEEGGHCYTCKFNIVFSTPRDVT